METRPAQNDAMNCHRKVKWGKNTCCVHPRTDASLVGTMRLCIIPSQLMTPKEFHKKKWTMAWSVPPLQKPGKKTWDSRTLQHTNQLKSSEHSGNLTKSVGLQGSSKFSKIYGKTTPFTRAWPGPAAARLPGAMLVPSPVRLIARKSGGEPRFSGLSPANIGSSCPFKPILGGICKRMWWSSSTCDNCCQIGDLDPKVGPLSETSMGRVYQQILHWSLNP